MLSSTARAVFIVLAAFGSGCTTSPEHTERSAPAPVYATGDHWTYQARDGFRNPIEWVETREVTAVDASGIRVRVTQTGDVWQKVWEERWSAPGQVALGAIGNDEVRRFEAPLQRFNFPLTPGQRWNQWVGTEDQETQLPGQVNRHVRVGAWAQLLTPMGALDAIKLRVATQYDDEEFWRLASVGTGVVWYAPALRGVAREEIDVQYVERGLGEGPAEVRTHHLILELVAFSPGRR